MAATGLPVKIGDTVYPSQKAAGRAFGVSREAICVYLDRHDGDMSEFLARKVGRAPNPIRIRGVKYPSQTAAAKALGVTCSAIAIAKKRGTLETVGLQSKSLDRAKGKG